MDLNSSLITISPTPIFNAEMYLQQGWLFVWRDGVANCLVLGMLGVSNMFHFLLIGV